jgi:hypothetical protein
MHVHVLRLVSVVKMVTILEEYTSKEQHSVVHLLWPKGLNAKNIHTEMFPLYGGKCLSCKALHNWIEKFSRGCLKVEGDAQPCCLVAIVTEAIAQ